MELDIKRENILLIYYLRLFNLLYLGLGLQMGFLNFFRGFHPVQTETWVAGYLSTFSKNMCKHP